MNRETTKQGEKKIERVLSEGIQERIIDITGTTAGMSPRRTGETAKGYGRLSTDNPDCAD
jgi:hypothetical protein